MSLIIFTVDFYTTAGLARNLLFGFFAINVIAMIVTIQVNAILATIIDIMGLAIIESDAKIVSIVIIANISTKQYTVQRM